MNIIKVNIYGYEKKSLLVGCINNKNSSCNLCGSKFNSLCKNCKSKENSFCNILDLYKGLNKFLKNTDISNSVDVNFIELSNKENVSDERFRVEEIMERGFNPPITVIDGIIRYYGGISNILVYKDVKELLN